MNNKPILESKEDSNNSPTTPIQKNNGEEKSILLSHSSNPTILTESTKSPQQSPEQPRPPVNNPPNPTPSTSVSIRTNQESWLDYDAAYTVFASAVVGVLSGFAVALFKLSIEALRETLYGTSLSEEFYWWLLPAVGGVGVSLVAALGDFAPGLRGSVQEIDQCSLNTQSDTRLLQAGRFIRKPLAAILTLGSGASLGPEGPSVEVGMSIARLCMPPSIDLGSSSSSSQSKVDEHVWTAARVRRNRLLLSAGAAAGVSAGFNAPLSGVFFALEIVQQNFPPLTLPTTSTPTSNILDNSQPPDTFVNSTTTTTLHQVQQDYFSSGSASITAILLASVLSALVSQVYLSESLVLSVPSYELKTPLVELPMYTLLGIVSGVVAGTFSALSKFFKGFFEGEAGPEAMQEMMKSLPQWSKPIIGGLICGIIGAAFPQILFFGYETLNTLLANKSMSSQTVLTLLGVKTLSTAVSAGSGLVGGTFAPSLFLGGMTGALFHNVINEIIHSGSASVPFELADVQAYALVGAAGVLSALFRAPLTASLLLFELTRDYEVILPLMATAGVGSIVGDFVERAFQEEERRDRDSVSWGDLSDE